MQRVQHICDLLQFSILHVLLQFKPNIFFQTLNLQMALSKHIYCVKVHLSFNIIIQQRLQVFAQFVCTYLFLRHLLLSVLHLLASNLSAQSFVVLRFLFLLPPLLRLHILQVLPQNRLTQRFHWQPMEIKSPSRLQNENLSLLTT